MFDFDKFVNQPSHKIFGRPVKYRPKNTLLNSFILSGDFHESYIDLNLKNAGADISSAKIVVFVRPCDFPDYFKEPVAGDYVEINNINYQIIDMEPHIPGSKKLILHKDE